MKTIQSLTVTIIAAALVSGCGFTKQANPDEVLVRFGQQLAQLESVHYQANLQLAGGLSQGFGANLDTAQLRIEGDIKSSLNSPVTYSATAVMSAQGSKGPVRLSGKMIGLADYTYFQFSDLALPTILPITLTDRQWYKIPSGQDLAASGQLNPNQQQAIREAFEQTRPLTTSEVLPLTTVNGQRAYHYRLQVDDDKLNQLISSLYKVVGIQAPTAPEFTLNGYQPEVYISTRDYSLLRVTFEGVYTHDHMPTNLELTVDLSSHNQSANILAPSQVKEVDIRKLINLPQ